MYKIVYRKQAINDIQNLKETGLEDKAKNLVEIIKESPYQNPPPYEKLVGELEGLYSRRINRQHRLVYQIFEKENAVKIIRMWTHYESI